MAKASKAAGPGAVEQLAKDHVVNSHGDGLSQCRIQSRLFLLPYGSRGQAPRSQDTFHACGDISEAGLTAA